MKAGRRTVTVWFHTPEGGRTEVEVQATQWQRVMLAQTIAPRSGRLTSIAAALVGIAYAICDLADAIRGPRDS